MPYATLIDIRRRIDQVTDTAANNALLNDLLAIATQVIDTELGFAFGTAAVGTRVVYGDGTDYLVPPAFVAGSVTAVTTLAGYTVPSYIVTEGMLVVTSLAGVVGSVFNYPSLANWRGVGGWLAGVPYTVSATYGYSAVPADIKECCLEIAVRLWRAKDAGFSDVVGVEGGGAVGYNGALPAMVKRILDKYAGRASNSVGVW